jgi:hypothetical protein
MNDAPPDALAMPRAAAPEVNAPAGYALIALVSVATASLAGEGADWILIGGAATSAVYLHGFLALNPRIVALELIALTLAGYLWFPPNAAVYWMMGSAVGGGVAAILTERRLDEDHHFFLPPLATIATTFLLFTFGRPGGWIDGAVAIRQWVEGYGEAFHQMLALPEFAQFRKGLQSSELWDWRTVGPIVGIIGVSSMVGLWAMTTWFFNRFARRRLGREEGILHSFLLFRVGPGYAFLLIATLILEILRVWLGREGLRVATWPLFAICAAALAIVHLAVLLFIVALHRTRNPEGSSLGPVLLLVGGLAALFWVGPIVGLADIWLDFRKTRAIRSRYG